MRLYKHLPNFMSEVPQYKELDKTLTIELDKVDYKLNNLQDDQFIEKATLKGLSRYEAMFNIAPVSDIDVRRFNILSKINSSLPYTMMWLINMLNSTVGRGYYFVELFNNTYELEIGITAEKENIIETLRADLRKKVPANLILNIYTLSTLEQTIHTGFVIRTGDKQII